MKIGYRASDGAHKYILLGKDNRDAERLAKGEMFACPACGEPLEFGVDLCRYCGAFLDKETRQIRTRISEAELKQNIEDSKARYHKARMILIAGGALLFLSMNILGNIPLILGSLVLLVIGVSRTAWEKAFIKKHMSQAVIPQILSEYFEDVVYDSNGTVPMEQVKDAFWGEYNRYYGSDYVKGRYKGIDIEMCDLKLQNVTTRTVTDDHGNSKVEEDIDTLLNGQWIIFDFHKQLSANVRVMANAGGKGGIETENPEFNKKFRVSSSSPHDAFYVLTPHMMEHLLIVTANAGGNVDFMFMKEGRLHLAVHTHRNHFETGSMKNANLDALKEKFRSEIDFILSLVNELKDELLSL